MTRTLFPGGWYVDALPTGEYCVLCAHSHIETHLGRVDFPAGEAFGVLYLRCTNIPEFSFGGQPHDRNDCNWQWWPDTGWAPHVTNYLGVSPVIFDLQGDWHQNDGSAGSQGYRYVAADGRLVTGDETYFSPAMELSEWSEIAPDLCIGQGHPDWARDAAWVWDRGMLRQLEQGPCTFIRVARVGDAVAVSFVTPAGAVIIQTTVAELRALPKVVWPDEPEPPVTTEPPPIDPPPVEPPIEPPVIPPVEQPDFPPASEVAMDPFSAGLRMGQFYARVDPTPDIAPWPGWFLVRLDGDPTDAHSQFTIAKPDGDKLAITCPVMGAGLLTADATEHGGGVCKQFYLSPTDDWGGYQRFSGWQLGPGGAEIVLVQYTGDRQGQCSTSLTVERR